MDRNGRPRRRPEAPSAPTTLTEIARRYYACAVALAKAMGLPMTEDFCASIAKASRAALSKPAKRECGCRRRSSSRRWSWTRRWCRSTARPPRQSPRAAGSFCQALTKNRGRPTRGQPGNFQATRRKNRPRPSLSLQERGKPRSPPSRWTPACPVQGQTIAMLKPAQLRMLLSKVDQLAGVEGHAWLPLLRSPGGGTGGPPAGRLSARSWSTVEGDGHGV